jgi:hypothetical protein
MQVSDMQVSDMQDAGLLIAAVRRPRTNGPYLLRGLTQLLWLPSSLSRAR